jgi:hypothetical protein
VLTVLSARGLRVSQAQRRRILAVTELAVLDSLLSRAVNVSSTSELLR